MRNILLLFIMLIPLWGSTQSRFEVLSDAGGVQFTPNELDTLEAITNDIVGVIDNYLPDVADEFKVYDFHFYLHSQASYSDVQELIQLAVNSIQAESQYYFLILKRMSPDNLIEEVYIEFKFSTDTLPCLDAIAIENTFKILANRHIKDKNNSTDLPYELDYTLLHSFEKAISDALCCSEYIIQNSDFTSGSQRTPGCAVINQVVVNDLVQFIQNDIGYNQGIQDLVSVITWYSNCQSTVWLPLHPQGITPHCFWVNTPDPFIFPYSGSDLPFTFGCVDGIAVGVHNFIDGVLALPELAASMGDLLDAYTIYYIKCSGRNPTPTEINVAFQILKDSTWTNSSLGENFKEVIEFLESSGESLLKGARIAIYGENTNEEWCSEKDLLRNSIGVLASSLTNLDSLKAYYDQIMNAFEDLWSDVDGIENEERYYQGCYMMSVAIEFVPISKIEYLSDFGTGLTRVTNGVNGPKKLASRNAFIAKGSSRLMNKLKLHPDYKALTPDLQNYFEFDFNNDYTSLLKISHEGYIKAWEGWIDFPILRKRIDVLENYYPKRSKIILDVEESFPGCHSKARHGTQLTSNDLLLRAKGEHPTLPRAKISTKFDSEQLHDDAVNTAFNQYKDVIDAHFANGGGYKEWDIDFGSQVGSGYYNSGDYGAGAVLNEVTTTKVKITFDKDLTNPTGYKMISAYPWYKP